MLRPLLPPNPYLRSLKVDCSKLDDSSIEHLVRPSLHEISLLNCADFSGRLLSLIGGQCKDLRFAFSSLVLVLKNLVWIDVFISINLFISFKLAVVWSKLAIV